MAFLVCLKLFLGSGIQPTATSLLSTEAFGVYTAAALSSWSEIYMGLHKEYMSNISDGGAVTLATPPEGEALYCDCCCTTIENLHARCNRCEVDYCSDCRGLLCGKDCKDRLAAKQLYENDTIEGAIRRLPSRFGVGQQEARFMLVNELSGGYGDVDQCTDSTRVAFGPVSVAAEDARLAGDSHIFSPHISCLQRGHALAPQYHQVLLSEWEEGRPFVVRGVKFDKELWSLEGFATSSAGKTVQVRHL